MEIQATITYDSYVVLRNILDDCRVLRLTHYDYLKLMDITLDLERQATRKERVADVVSLHLNNQDYLCIRECILAVERTGTTTRASSEVQTLAMEMDWSRGLGDALIG